jgi:hypothetical protein
MFSRKMVITCRSYHNTESQNLKVHCFGIRHIACLNPMKLNILYTTNSTQRTGKLLVNIFSLINISTWRQQTVTFNDVPCGRVDPI